MTETDKAYLAAIIDGEANLGIYRSKTSYTPVCIISNTNKELIEYLYSICKLGNINYDTINFVVNWKQSYTLTIKGEQLKLLIQKIKNYLVVKEYQAKLVEMYFQYPKKKYFLSDEEKESRKDLYNKTLILNERGVDNYKDHYDLQMWDVGYFIEKVQLLTEPQKAYIAGITDGEGNINYRRRNNTFETQYSISNTYSDLIKYLKSITGVGHILLCKSKLFNKKTSSTWQLRKQEIFKLLTVIRSYLFLKREHAELALKTLILRRVNRYSPLSKEELEEREFIFSRFRHLNKTGVE